MVIVKTDIQTCKTFSYKNKYYMLVTNITTLTHYKKKQPMYTTLTCYKKQPMYVFIQLVKLCILGDGEVVGVDMGQLCTHAANAVLQQLGQQRHTVFRSLRNTAPVNTPQRAGNLTCLPCFTTLSYLLSNIPCAMLLQWSYSNEGLYNVVLMDL